ncbi:hypothetical protein HDV01_006115 [Terramyces sp. JEL0728]|nr:hypothetical protein HDV01_006115 [Terramyces sp. JEL0728]
MKKTNTNPDKPSHDAAGWEPVKDSYIALDGLVAMFESEVRYMLKSLQAVLLSKENVSQYRIVASQFLHCLEKYKKYLDKKLFLKKCLDFGSNLLEIKGCHSLAYESCFLYVEDYFSAMPTIARVADVNEENAGEIEEIEAGLYFSKLVVQFLSIVNVDFGINHPQTIEQVKQLVDELKNNAFQFTTQNYPLKWTVLMTVYHLYQIAQFLANVGNPLMAKEVSLWILSFLENQTVYEMKEISNVFVFITMSSYKWIVHEAEDRCGLDFLKTKLSILTLISKPEDTAHQKNIQNGIKLLQFLIISMKIKSGVVQKPDILEKVKQLMAANVVTTCNAKSFLENFSWQKEMQTIIGWSSKHFLFSYNIFNFPVDFQNHKSHHLDIYRKFISQYPLNTENFSQLEANTVPLKEENKAEPDTNKKLEKKKVIKEDTEELKLKKSCWEEINSALDLLTSKAEQFSIITLALEGIITFDKRLKIQDKVDDNSLAEYIISMLMDKAFNLLSGSYALKAEIKEKRQHFEAEEVEIPKVEDSNYEIHEVVKFSQFLFRYRNWSKLETLFDIIRSFPIKRTNPLYLETNLRLAAAQFVFSFQIDRKVFFQSNLAGRATPSDFRASRFDLTDQVQQTTAIFCNSILECLECGELLTKSPYLVIDSALLLWSFVEPFLRDIKSTLDAPKIYYLKADDAILLVLGFIHSIFCRIHYFTDTQIIVLGVGISQKLALIYECMGKFEDATSVLKECCVNINRARDINIGGAVDFKDCATADPSYHKIYSNTANDRTIRDFACLYVDVLSFYYRCIIKNDYEQTLSKLRKKKEETLKLKHIKFEITTEFQPPNESILFSNCGDDPVKRGLFLLATILHGKGLSYEDRGLLLRKAVKYLRDGRKQEDALLDSMKDDNNSSAPKLIRRTSNSITISIPSQGGRTLHWYQAFGSTANKNIKSRTVSGTRIMRPLLLNSLVTLTGLDSSFKYLVNFALYDSVNADSSNGIQLKSDSISVVASLPLSINLCWTYILSIAMEMDDKEIVTLAMSTIESQLIKSKQPVHLLRNFMDGLPVEDSQTAFEINYETLTTTNKAIIRGFIQSCFYYIEMRKSEFNNSEQSNSLLLTQYLRFELCRDYLIASECAKYTDQPSLEILCILKLYQEILPFLRTDIYTPFILNILLKCHSTLLKQAGAFENDKSKGLREFLVPITFHLVTRLIELGDVPLAAQVAYDTNSLINISTYSAEIKIINSNMMETSLLGYIYKPHKGKAKRSSSNYLTEFGYLAKVAVTKPSKFGVSFQRKQFDMFYELMEVLMAKHKAVPLSLMNDPNARKTLSRKTLDNSTTLKDVFLLFITAGPETTMQELTKFRKHPRYVEIVTRIVSWCIEKESIDTAIRLSVELEDWVDRRCQIVSRMDELLEDVSHHKKEIVIKRRRRQLFAQDKAALMESIKGKAHHGDHTRGRELEKSEEKKKVVVEHSPERNTADSRPASTTPSLTSGSSSSRHSSKERPRSTATTPPRAPVSRASSGSPKNSSNSSPKRDLSRANSASPPNTNHEANADSELTSIQMAKRKRATHRHAYFSGMSTAERDRIDQAVKVLDTKLYYLWHRRCYARRLRLILDYENPWRSSLLYFRARALFIQFRKDSKLYQYNLNDFKENALTEWVEFRSSGSFMIKQLNKKENNLDPSSFQHTQTVDMIQAFTQSIVIASRSYDPLKILKYSKSLWVAMKFMFYTGKLDIPFWKQTLWRGLFTVGNVIVDTLKSLQISKVPQGNAFLQNSTPIGAKKGVIPVKAYFEVIHDQFIGSWTDRQQFNQHQIIDLAFCSEFLLFIIEVIHSSGRYNRLLQFTKKVQNTFGPTLDCILNPLIQYCTEVIKNNNAVLHTAPEFHPGRQAEEQLFYCRYKVAAYHLESCLEGKILHEKENMQSEIFDIYENAILKASKENNKCLAGSTSIEFGNFLHEVGNFSGATTFWSKGLDLLSGQHRVLKTITKYFEIDTTAQFSEENARVMIDKLGGIFKAIQVANALTRIAKYTYYSNVDKKLEIVWIAAHLNIACLYYAIPNPTNYLAYVDIQLDSLYSGSDIFMSKHELNPVEYVDNLLYLSNLLIQNQMAVVCMPLLASADYISKNILCSIPVCSAILIIKSEALTQIGLINEAVNCLYQASKSNTLKKKSEDAGTDMQFDNSFYPLTANHFMVLKQVLILPLSDKTKLHNPPKFAVDYDIARIKLVLTVFESAGVSNNTTSCEEFESYKQEINRIDVPKLDYDAWQIDVITTVRAMIYKHTQNLQTNFKGKQEIINASDDDVKYQKDLESTVSSYQQLILLFDVLRHTYLIQKRFKSALKWALSIRKLLSNLKTGDTHKQNIYQHLTAQLGNDFLYQNLDGIVKCLFAEGKYSFAYSLAKEFEEEYYSLNSKLINAKISNLILTILTFSGLDDKGLKYRVKSLQRLQETIIGHPMAVFAMINNAQTLANSELYLQHYESALQYFELMDKHITLWKNNYQLENLSTFYFKWRCEFLIQKYSILRSKLITISETSTNEEVLDLTNSLRETVLNCKFSAHSDVISILKYIIALDSFKARAAFAITDQIYKCLTDFTREMLQSILQFSVQSEEKKFHTSILLLTLDIEAGQPYNFDTYCQVYRYSQCKLIAGTSDIFSYKDAPIGIQMDFENFKSLEKDDPIFESIDLLSADENSITEKYKGSGTHSITVNDLRTYKKSLTDIFDDQPAEYNERYMTAITRFMKLQKSYKDKVDDIFNSVKISSTTPFYFLTWLHLPIINSENNLPVEIIYFAKDLSSDTCRLPENIPSEEIQEFIESSKPNSSESVNARQALQSTPSSLDLFNLTELYKPENAQVMVLFCNQNNQQLRQEDSDGKQQLETRESGMELNFKVLVRNVPKVLSLTAKNSINSIYSKLAFYTITKDLTVKEQAENLWKVVLTLLYQIIRKKPMTPKSFPPLTNSNVSVLSAIFACETVGGSDKDKIKSTVNPFITKMFPEKPDKKLNILKPSQKKVAAKKSYKQTCLNLGQKKLKEYETCVDCQMQFNRFSKEDLQLHSKYHSNIFHWSAPESFSCNYIALIKPDNPKWKNLVEILNIVNKELGAAYQEESEVQNHKAFICVSKNQIIGMIVALDIDEAFRISNNEINQRDRVNAQVGISRIWVSGVHRRQGLAKSMLDFLRTNYYYGIALPLDSLAFSQPTDQGNYLAKSYFNRPDFLVYIE